LALPGRSTTEIDFLGEFLMVLEQAQQAKHDHVISFPIPSSNLHRIPFAISESRNPVPDKVHRCQIQFNQVENTVEAQI
jgi:hypothetical protein